MGELAGVKSFALAGLDEAVSRRIQQFERDRILSRIWARDPEVWGGSANTPELGNRLGWLTIVDRMTDSADEIAAFVDSVVGDFRRVVLCGMGGSSLAPAVFRRVMGPRSGFPDFLMLDSTAPEAVRSATSPDSTDSLFLISSKSGTTLETASFFQYFWKASGERGSQFVAITDPGTSLEEAARNRRFRCLFRGERDVGGRFSALSVFGLLPAALVGIDIRTVLSAAAAMARLCERPEPAGNPGASLGMVMGEAALAGRDKLTLALSPALQSFGLWLEQLIAESTGKNARGIIPIIDHELRHADTYGEDRLVVAMTLEEDAGRDIESALETLAGRGHPVIHLSLQTRQDLGAELFRWEFATAVAGAIVGVNPFDQPNVAESKVNTNAVLEKRGNPTPPDSPEAIEALLAQVKSGDYLAVMAYLPPNRETDARLGSLRDRLEQRLRVPTTVGYGPRFLHSTGQLHKGGPPTGHFLQIVDAPSGDVPIPGVAYTFGELIEAQAEGDYRALRARERPVVRTRGIRVVEELI